jgi:hypothetical protein
VQQLSLLPEAEWNLFVARWYAIRAHQHTLLLEAPQLEPNQFARMVAINRLSTRTVALIEDVQALRMAWAGGATVNGPNPAPAVPDHKERKQELLAEQPSNYLDGISNMDSDDAPVIDHAPTYDEVMHNRNRRPGKEDYREGYGVLQ